MGNQTSKINDFFNGPFKDFGYKLGDTLGKLTSTFGQIFQNMLSMSQNVSNFMGGSFFIPVLIGVGCIFVAYKLKIF